MAGSSSGAPAAHRELPCAAPQGISSAQQCGLIAVTARGYPAVQSGHELSELPVPVAVASPAEGDGVVDAICADQRRRQVVPRQQPQDRNQLQLANGWPRSAADRAPAAHPFDDQTALDPMGDERVARFSRF